MSGHGDMASMATATMAMTGTATMDMAGATSSAAAMKMKGMGGMGGGCKISMLWNWNTIDSCFIARSWRITSRGMFAGSCIGVLLLVMSLEMLRRAVKEFDRYIVRQHTEKYLAAAGASPNGEGSDSSKNGSRTAICGVDIPPCRPNLWQQAVRALLHMVQFAVAYFVMLLAMYYNGYIIICIFIGSYLGSFVFHWEPLTAGGQQTSATREATVCCG